MTKIKKLRSEIGMSQKQLAIAMRVSQPTASAWENGVKFPAGDKLKKLAQILGTTVDDLLEDIPSYQLGSNSLDIPDTVLIFHRHEFEDLTPDEVEALAFVAKTFKDQRERLASGTGG